MTQVAIPACPHCGAGNSAGSTFCAACGKALPMASSGPRVLGKSDFATTAAGQKLQGDELVKMSKRATGALLAAAIIQTIVPVIGIVLVQTSRGRMVIDPLILVVNFGLAGIFWGLWVWSRFQPLPASIIGLVLYGTMVAINVVSASSHLNETGNQNNGIGGVGISWVNIVIIAVFVQAIQAGSKYRKLMQQQSGI